MNVLDGLAIPVLVLAPLLGAGWLLVADRVGTPPSPRVSRGLAVGAAVLAALAAVGSTPRPALVLLAYCTAQLLTQIPMTPGGLGFVEAGLTATLTLAGVETADAVLATFAYRLFTYWLPLPLGLVGGLLHRRRYARS